MYRDKIFLPQRLQSHVVAWYHEYLQHPGKKRTEETICQWFHWLGLRSEVSTFCKTCELCQVSKRQRKKYGYLKAKEAESDPWEQVYIDLVGPLSVKLPNGKKKQLLCLTCIDPATGWFKMIDLPDKQAYMVQEAFNDIWLCRYPRSQLVPFDNGTEFKA